MTSDMRQDENHESLGLWLTIVGLLVIGISMIAIQSLMTYFYMDFLQQTNPSFNSSEFIQNLENDGVFVCLTVIATAVVSLATIFGILKITNRREMFKYLGLRWFTTKQLLLWIAIMAICYVLLTVVAIWFDRPQVPDFMLKAYESLDHVWLLWLVVVVIAPCYEEVLFRGFLFKGFQATVLGNTGAVVLTSLIFAIIHLQYDLYDMTQVFIIGMLLGIARVRTDSLVLAIILHAVINAVAMIETMSLLTDI